MKKILDVYKKLSWKIKYDTGDMPYPPVMFWKKNIKFKDILSCWKNTLNKYYNDNCNHNMGLYIHLPFCYTKCHYCTCFIKVSHKENEYEKYIDFIEKECIKYSSTFKGIKFNTVYIGGGTPTILTVKQIDRFYKILHKYFDLTNVKQIMTEGSPYTTTKEKLDILAKNGVNKMTFGVQSIDTDVLNKNNRPQDSDKIGELINNARKSGIKYINIDLMVGIPGQSMKSLQKTIDFVNSELNPDTIHINPFWPTKKTTFDIQKGIYSLKDIEKRNKMKQLSNFLEKDSHNNASYKADNIQLYNSKKYNSSILGIGVGAISHAFGSMHYTKESFSDYYSWLGGDTNINIKGCFLNIEDEIIIYLINNFRNGIYFSDFNKLFNQKLEYSFIYKKLMYLEKMNILILKSSDKGAYYISKINSELYSNIYSKFLYKDNIIKDFIENFNIMSKEYQNIDIKLKQFFSD